MSESKRLHYVGHCPGSPCAVCGVVEDVRGTTAMAHVRSLCAGHFKEWASTVITIINVAADPSESRKAVGWITALNEHGQPAKIEMVGPLGGILSDEPPFTRPATPGEEPIPGALLVGRITEDAPRTIREELPIPPAVVPPGWVEEGGRYFFRGVEKTAVERMRAALEALSDADYLEALPRRCLGCGSKDLPCHCGRVVEARENDGDLVPDSRGYLDDSE